MKNEEPIRIAHVIGKMVGGGVESFIMNYYRHIDKTKIQFDFIIDSDSTNVPRKEIGMLGGKIIEIPPYQNIFAYIKELTKVLKENKYKIVHSHLNALSMFPLYCAYCANVPVRIAHSHSTTNKKEWKKNIIKNILKPFSKVFATDYFACSEHAARWLFGNKTFEKGKITIINNAIDLDKFVFSEKIYKEKCKELNLENKIILGHVGRFVKQKNHEFLIDVFYEIRKKNKNTVLLLIGDGPLENQIKEKVNSLDIQDYVYFLGNINNVNELMQIIDIFVFPSLYEGLGISLIEAQSIGCTCVASKNVPIIAKISEKMFFMDLKNGAENWGMFINSLIGKYDKTGYINESEKEMYNIRNEVKKIEKKYISLYETINN